MRNRDSVVFPLAVASLVLVGWLVSVPLWAQTAEQHTAAAQPPAPRKKGGTGQRAHRSERDEVARRQEWFYRQRRYPLPMIPGGARTNALQQREANRKEQVRRGLIADQANPDPIVPFNSWTPIGPTPTAASGLDFLDETFNETNFSGRINAIAVDPTSPNIVYLGGADGGLWRSTDTGATWTVLTDTQPSLAIGAIAIDPGSCGAGYCQTVYVGTGEANNAQDNYYGAGILKLTMTGTANNPTFTFTQLGANAGSVTLLNYTPSQDIPTPTSFVGPFSADLGGSYFSDIVVNPAAGHNNQLLASVRIFETADGGQSSGIFCSDNGGVNWTQVVKGAEGSALVISPDGTTAYGALGTPSGSPSNGVYKTTSATSACSSQGWVPVTGTFPLPLGDAVGRITLALAPTTPPNTLYAAVANGGTDSTSGQPDASNDLIDVYKTTNGGQKWTHTNAPNTCHAQCWYDMTIKVHPNNANVVFLGGSAITNSSSGNDIYLLRSENAGGTWDDGSLKTEIAFDGNNEIHVDQHAIAFSPPACNIASCVMLVGNDGGVWSTPINGTGTTGTGQVTWTDLNSTLTLSQFYPGISIHPSSQLVAIGGLQDNGSQKYDAGTVPGSTIWTQINGADGGATYFDPASPNVAYATTEFSPPIPGQPFDIFFIQKSVNNGDIDPTGVPTFSPATNGIDLNGSGSDYAEFIPSLAGDPTPGNNRVLYYPTCQLYQTRDGAANWAAMGSSSLCAAGAADYVAIAAAADGNTVYAVDSIGHVHVTTNALAGGAAVWSDVSKSPLPAASSTTSPVDGRESVSVAVSPTNPLFALVGYSGFCGFTNSSTGILDNVGHIFKTQDGGNTWTDISGGCNGTVGQALPNTPVNAIVIDPTVSTNQTIYVATDVGVFITSNGGGTWLPLDQSPRTLPDGAVLSLTLHNPSRTLRAGLHGRGVWDYQLPQQTFSLASITPVFGVQGSASDVTLTVNGQGFASGDMVNFNGVALATTFKSATQLTATIPFGMLANPGTATISVFDTTNGTSNVVPFSVELVFNASAPPPPNDLFANAIVVPAAMTSFTDIENTANATMTATDPNPSNVGGCILMGAGITPPNENGAANSIWYSYTPATNATVEADTVGSTVPSNATLFAQADTILEVVTGTPGSFTPVACNDDIDTNDGFLTSRVNFPATAGVTYYFMVSEYEGIGGITVFNLNASPTPTLTSITPSIGSLNTSFPVTLAGMGFTAPLLPNISSAFGTFSNVQLMNSMTIKATLTIPPGATVGSTPVSVTTDGGTTTNMVSFQVTSTPPGPPTLTSLTPFMGAQGGSVAVTLTGTNFDPAGSTILFNGGTGITVTNQTVVSNSEITATFNIASGTAPGMQNISVMTSQGTSTTQPFTVEAAPTLTSLSITSGNVGSTTATITLTGTNFFSPASISFSGSGITANNVMVTSPTTITATFTIAATASAGAQTVFVNTDGATTTNVVQFTVDNPAPAITSLSPTMANAGAAAQTLTINGTGFVSTSTVTYNSVAHAATFVSGTQLTIQLSTADQATGGTFPVVVTNPAPGGGSSTAVNFTVNNLPPTITSLSPTSASAGAAAQTLTINGTNFVSTSTVTYGGVAHAATFVSATKLTIQLTAPDQATGGQFPVIVTNPAPGGGSSTAMNFTVDNLVPTITSLSPTSANAGSASQTLTINGTNFVSTSTVTYNGTMHTATFVNAMQLTIQLTAGDQATGGTFAVVVTNPAPMGGASAPSNFTVNNLVPTITSLSPNSANAGAAAQTLTINGTNFVSTSTVTYNGTMHVATFVNAMQITIQLTAADQATGGILPVVVTNPAPGGGPSTASNFTVNNLVPAITSLSPNSANAGSAAQTLTINGTNFVSTSTVTYNGVAHAATFVSATKLTIQLSAPDQATGGLFPVIVTNPAPMGGASASSNFTVNNLVPTITSLSPSSTIEGTAAQMLTINGTNFVSTSTVTYNGVAHAATFVSATKLTIQLTTGDQATAGNFPVVVTNPAPGGGPSTATNFVVNNPVPSITSLSPPSAVTGSAAQTLTINGTNFVSTSTVTYNGIAHAATFVNSMQLTIQLSTADQGTAGPFPVVVTNPAPGGGSSPAVNFQVGNPVPAITSLSPNSANAGAAAQTLTINGTGFLSTSTVTYNGTMHTATFVSSMQLTIQLTAADQMTGGMFPVIVTNPGPAGGPSTAVNFTVNNLVPTISSLSPNSANAGAAAQTLTINGTNFVSTSTVTYNGTMHTATFVNAMQLTIQLTAADQATGGMFPVIVTNPAPGGGSSSATNFTVNNLVPTISSLSPSSATAGAAAQTLTINGTNFVSTSTVTYNGVAHMATFVSATKLTIQLTTADQATAGTFAVIVTNPAPGGGPSTAMNFTVNNPAPTITSLSPTSANAGAAAQTLTINGTNFVSTSTVTYNGVQHAATFVNSMQLTIQLTTADQMTGGMFSVVVTNPMPGGGSSTAITFTVDNLVPTISSLSPSSANAGSAGQTLTINGTNFLSTSTVTYNGAMHAATFVNSMQLTIQLTAADQLTGGLFPVIVTNPAPGGGSSTATNFTVNNLVPTITSLSPNSANAGATAQTLTINGTNFVSTSTVTYNGTAHAATFVNAMQLTIQLSAADQATGGTFPVIVTNPAPAGGSSTALNFTVNNLVPTITTLSPSTASAGAAAQTLTINGTNFVSTSTVTYNGVAHAATFVSATKLTIQLTLADQATFGNYPVVVSNPAPGGGPSNTVNFVIDNPVPTITSLSPTSANVGAAAQTLTINGTNFVASSTVTYNTVAHAAAFVSAMQLTIQLTVGDQATAGTFPVVVTNPVPGGGSSTAMNFTVNNLVPTITSLSPNSANAGAAAQTLTINGTNFVSTSTVTYNGTMHTATFVNAMQLTIQLTAADQATGGIFPVVVTNPAPGGGPSTASNFTVNNLVPTITSLSPNSANAGAAAQTLTINGTNFVTTSTVTYNGTMHAATFMNAMQLTIQLTAADQATPGTFPVVVTNPAPAGGPSTASNFTVNAPMPTITSISPTGATLGTGNLAVTITGTGFFNGPMFQINVPAGITVSNITVVNSTTITATFTIAGNAATGPQIITVKTAGGTSTNVLFGVGTDFMLTDNPTSSTITAGSGTGTTFTLAPTTPNSPFPVNVQFTAMGLPNLTSCTFASTANGFTGGSTGTMPAADGTAATMVTFMCTTTAPSSVLPQLRGPRGPVGTQPLVILAWGTLLMALGAGIIATRRERGARLRWALAALLILAFSGFTSACGGGGGKMMLPGTNPGTYPITVMAVSANASHSATFTVTVQ